MTTRPPASRRADQREATRLAVLEAAEGLFLERGFESTTVREVAEAAGVSVGTVMSVGDKRALLAAVFARGIGLVDERRRARAAARGFAAASVGRVAAQARVGATWRGPVARIVAIVEPYAALFAGRVELARAYAGVLATGRHGEVVFGELAEALRREFERELRVAPSAHPEPAAAAQAIYLVYMGALFVWAGSGATEADAFLEAFGDGVRAVVRESGAR